MPEYNFDFKVSGFKSVTVNADNYEDALNKANRKMEEADCGELENIEWKHEI